MDTIEQGLEILKQLGFTYEWRDHTHDLLEITDPVTGEWTCREPYGAARLLDFLMKTGKLVSGCSEAGITEEDTKPGTDPASEEQIVQALSRRARAIGTEIERWNDDTYCYHRYRFLIPGTRYKFYFYVDNALDPRRERRRERYLFGADELEELEKWVAHDEKIFAECNQKYSVQEN